MTAEPVEPDDERDEQEDKDPPRFDAEDAARFRAAVGYSGKSEKEIALALGVKERTVRRLRSGRAELTHERKMATIGITGVPPWFIDGGFDPPPATEDPTLAERTAALESKMDVVLGILTTRVARDAGRADELLEEGEGRAGDGRGDR